MKNWPSALALLLLFTASVSAGPEVKADPLIGKWIWQHEGAATFNADGTASVGPTYKGTWVFTKNPEVQRKYQLTWNEGQVIDKATLSGDGQTLQVQNSRGEKFTARRATVTPAKGDSR